MFYLKQIVERHYWVDKEELLLGEDLFENERIVHYFSISNEEYVINVGEVYIHFSNRWGKKIKESIFKNPFKFKVKQNKEDDFSKIKEISGLVNDKLGHSVYVLVSTYNSIRNTLEKEDFEGNKYFDISNEGKQILLELFKELTVPDAQRILNKSLENLGVLKEVSDLLLENNLPSTKKLSKLKTTDKLAKAWTYAMFKDISKEKLVYRILFSNIFDKLDSRDTWKEKLYSKLDDISSINLIDHLDDINSYYDQQKKIINKYFEVKDVMDKPETILSYEELDELKNKRVDIILGNDEEEPKSNVLVRLPMVLEYKGEQKVTTSIPFRIHVLRGLNKMLISKDSYKILKNNFKNNHKLFLFYKRVDVDELIHEYSLYKKDIIRWFKRSKSVNSWFGRRERSLLGYSKTFGYFSWDTQNKNNPGALIAPACNYIGYNHLSWIGVTANIYEKITGNFGKRTISNAILKSTKFRLSYINFDDVAISLKLDNKRALKEIEYSSSLCWVLQVSEFEDNLTTIGEGSLITEKANEVVSKQLNYKSLSEDQPIKVFFEGYGEKALTYAESKVAKICYSGTDKEVFTGDLKHEFVSFIKGYTKRENKEAIATSGRKRANKALKNEDHAKSILVDAYDDKGNLIYERANLHLHKIFIDVTMDRTPKIVRQKMSSELTKSLTIKSKRTKLDYSKHENKAQEKAKTMKLMLELDYRTLSISNPILNDHYIPEITPSKYSDFYLFNSEEEIALLLEHGIKIHGIWLRLPKYYEAIPNIGVSYNNILSLLYERIHGKPIDERTMFDDLDYVLKEIEAMYEKSNNVYIDMVRSRLAIKENLKTQEMHVSPLVLEKLIEEFSDKYLKEFKKLGADIFVEKYKITVYTVRFPDFGYSGDYTITAVDNSLNYTSAISTLNAALIGGDIDDDTLQSKIIEISIK